jgi:hypothetical protein
MQWFFQRENEYLRIETTHDRSSGAFMLILHLLKGTQQIYMFED